MREPGLYYGIPNVEYHRGLIEVHDMNGLAIKPLSSTGAKTLVRDSPADYLWQLENPVSKTAFSTGTAVHELVLEGQLQSVEIFEFPNWMSKAAKEAKAECLARGGNPMLERDLVDAYAIAEAVKNHQLASSLITDGNPEVSALVWDPEYKVWFQVRFDWLRNDGLIVDLKTSRVSNPSDFNREIATYYYHLQASLYMRAAELLGIPVQGWRWVVVCSEKPHNVFVVEYTEIDRLTGDQRMHTALTKYADGVHQGVWPAHPDLYFSELPAYATYDGEEGEVVI
ncbi:PD-(D/E)XK nuclease-like domain-containing protein [Timonella sp. A28]|uniref:PD-(D/E)XK nuclease-like domain-containing protein n=1 Tax=Timonella sp. A28 TaxID=3442640 RepID=UPI003EBD7BF9